MITYVRVIRWSNIDVFWERPVSCLPTIIKIGQTCFAMFRDPTNKPWARCLCILKSSLGRVLQRFRKNGVIEGNGRGSSAGRQQPPQRPQADGSRRCRQLRAQADGSRRARARRQPLPTCARAPWPTTADVRAGLADHCRCTRMPGPTTADGCACLGRPLPMHVCLRAGMCAGAWAGPCRRGRVGAGGRQQRSRATSGRPVAVHLTFGVCGPGRRPFPPGCRAHSRGRGRRARPRARTTGETRPRDVDGPTGAACWVFVISRKAPSLSCGCAHTLALWHIFHLGLGTVLIRDLAIFS